MSDAPDKKRYPYQETSYNEQTRIIKAGKVKPKMVANSYSPVRRMTDIDDIQSDEKIN